MGRQRDNVERNKQAGAGSRGGGRTGMPGRAGRRVRVQMLLMLIVIVCCISACAGKEKHAGKKTPEETAETVMEAIRGLDLDTLNDATDNCTGIRRGWFGIPVGKEYKVFHELLQGGSKESRQYKRNYRIAAAITENLEWEIQDIKEKGNRAEIRLLISNVDMSEAQGRYMVRVMENMVKDEGAGLHGLTGNIFDLSQEAAEGLCQCIEETEGISAIEVTVLAKKEKEGWMIHIDDAFVNAFLGNIDSEEIPEEFEMRFEELEAAYEKKLEKWGEGILEEAEDWTEKWRDSWLED